MSSKFDSSDEEWSDIFARITSRVEKSSRKARRSEKKPNDDLSNICSNLNRMSIRPVTPKTSQFNKQELVSTVKKLFLARKSIDSQVTEVEDNDSIIPTGRRKNRIFIKSDDESSDSNDERVESGSGSDEDAEDEAESCEESLVDRSAVEGAPTEILDCSEPYTRKSTSSSCTTVASRISEHFSSKHVSPEMHTIRKSTAFDTFCEPGYSRSLREASVQSVNEPLNNETKKLIDSDNDPSLILTKKKKAKPVIISSDEEDEPEVSRRTLLTASAKVTTPVSTNYLDTVSNKSNKTPKQFTEYRNVAFSSDDEWGEALKVKKSLKKTKKLAKPITAKIVRKENKSIVPKPPLLEAGKTGTPVDEWLKLVSPERRDLEGVKITASKPRNPLTPLADNLKTSTPKKMSSIPFHSPLPKYALFSKYSPIVDQQSVLRKLGIDFNIDEKPSQKLWLSNKMLTNLMHKLDQGLFNGTLKNHQVEITWSGRLTSAAGITHYKSKLLMVECDIKLSRPLLQLRPAKSLVETLIHEMIHAYLAVTRDPGSKGHGPTFKHHMNRINQMTNLDITIYHSYHDEVNHYKNQNVWRCTGVCSSMRDFKYGYVRRAMNRAPGPHEFWWKKHAQFCDGNFERVYDHPWK